MVDDFGLTQGPSGPAGFPSFDDLSRRDDIPEIKKPGRLRRFINTQSNILKPTKDFIESLRHLDEIVIDIWYQMLIDFVWFVACSTITSPKWQDAERGQCGNRNVSPENLL